MGAAAIDAEEITSSPSPAPALEEKEAMVKEIKKPVFRDIRRYYCEFCGICRSKKALIRSHILSYHQEDMADDKKGGMEGATEEKGGNTCEECGASFRKPAHLKQHMQSHSLQRPFACPLDDCPHSYRRKDHLTRHSLRHEGKIFTCPSDNCNGKFAFQGNMTRHVKEFHNDVTTANCSEKQHVCQEEGCGKVFKYASRLRKHEGTHVKLEYVEVICGEPSCLKHFTNSECLKAHIESSHRYIKCEMCGARQLKKNFKRHKRAHDGKCGKCTTERVKCTFEDCLCTFSNKSNLTKHLKAVHEDCRPFTCAIAGCGQKFSYKHVRDNHEKSAHVYVQGDFVETDELFHSRPRGGRKRKCLSVESLLRKRIVPPAEASTLDDGTEYLRWLLTDNNQE
ncbi:general transcription factor IIIA protein [Dioscorea alata]|uniref:General transcription factor IIIA protein n=1 Tax=Dioscorea alata TaxID=55571 RepID=A0ACB7TY62_DIOAL|nr:general transcription factor IIIA protein [Dioscorea alata]